MSFDVKKLTKTVEIHGQVCRLVVADIQGSGPREAGAAMLVWAGGQSGTIGGGALEFEASNRARDGLHGPDWVHRYALGPGLGQCCGGNVTIVAEIYDAERVQALDDFNILRRVSGEAELSVQLGQSIEKAQASRTLLPIQLTHGWFVEPVLKPDRAIWIYGAGHVGRALVEILAPFPDVAITWVDTAPDRFPTDDGLGPDRLIAANMAESVRFAPNNAQHLIATFSHEIDLAICHALLSHDFQSAGLIGSATKWRRFQKRLVELGHSLDRINRIDCPIGDPEMGKHPQAIAVGVVAGLLLATRVANARVSNLGG